MNSVVCIVEYHVYSNCCKGCISSSLSCLSQSLINLEDAVKKKKCLHAQPMSNPLRISITARNLLSSLDSFLIFPLLVCCCVYAKCILTPSRRWGRDGGRRADFGRCMGTGSAKRVQSWPHHVPHISISHSSAGSVLIHWEKLVLAHVQTPWYPLSIWVKSENGEIPGVDLTLTA